MHHTIFYLFIAFTVGAVSAGMAQTEQTMEKQTFSHEQQKVLGTIENMVAAFHKKDIEGVMACYEPGATIVFEPRKPVSGSGALRAGFEEIFTLNPAYQFHGHEVFITGDMATHITPWTMKGVLPDGSPISQSGLSVAVLHKQANGTWLMVFDNPHGQLLMENQ